MKFFINTYFILLVFILSIGTVNPSNGQGDVIEEVSKAIKIGDVKKLTSFFHESIELNFAEEKSQYSKVQAEFILKDFFEKYPPINFEYKHRGTSNEGLKYTIGKYSYKGGAFRVYMLIKEIEGSDKIDMLDFGEE